MDRMIFFHSIKQPDILEDFDADLKIEFQYQLNRGIPEDRYFQPPPHYIQPLSSYAKHTSCLDYDGTYLVSADKATVYVWEAALTAAPHCLTDHTEIVGKTILHGTLLVTSSCDKTVRVWSLISFSCIQIIRPENKFNNISFPKIAVNDKYLLASSPDHVYIYRVGRLGLEKYWRRIEVPELMTDIHIEPRGLAFSCYNAVHMWDFWNIDETTKPFHGYKTRF